MTFIERMITILICGAATILTRAIPFILFDKGKETPKFIKYLGDVLPAATFGMLIIFCLKSFDIRDISTSIKMIIAIIVSVIIHLYKGKISITMIVGTLAYILLVNLL